MAEELAPEKIVINGVEYDPADAQTLIELGGKTRDFEKQYNTDISKVMPDYTRATQEAAQYKKELEAAKANVREAETPIEKTKALQALRELGGVDQNYLKETGYLTRDEAEKLFETKQTQQENKQAILNTGERLEKEIDGSDGRLRYNSKAVLAYASSYGFFKDGIGYEKALKDAYEEMAGSSNDAWKQAQIDAKKRPGLTTLKPGGVHTKPEEKEIGTEQQAREALRELLGQTE